MKKNDLQLGDDGEFTVDLDMFAQKQQYEQQPPNSKVRHSYKKLQSNEFDVQYKWKRHVTNKDKQQYAKPNVRRHSYKKLQDPDFGLYLKPEKIQDSFDEYNSLAEFGLQFVFAIGTIMIAYMILGAFI
jgi:hypothetical protein